MCNSPCFSIAQDTLSSKHDISFGHEELSSSIHPEHSAVAQPVGGFSPWEIDRPLRSCRRAAPEREPVLFATTALLRMDQGPVTKRGHRSRFVFIFAQCHPVPDQDWPFAQRHKPIFDRVWVTAGTAMRWEGDKTAGTAAPAVEIPEISQDA